MLRGAGLLGGSLSSSVLNNVPKVPNPLRNLGNLGDLGNLGNQIQKSGTNVLNNGLGSVQMSPACMRICTDGETILNNITTISQTCISNTIAANSENIGTLTAAINNLRNNITQAIQDFTSCSGSLTALIGCATTLMGDIQSLGPLVTEIISAANNLTSYFPELGMCLQRQLGNGASNDTLGIGNLINDATQCIQSLFPF
jgi:hypothetical protein